jgi:hypothetical protein
MNSSLIQETKNAFKINLGTEQIPKAIPVVEVGDKSVKNLRHSDVTVTNATSGSIISAASHAQQDYYLVGFRFQVVKDAGANSTDFALVLTSDQSTLYFKKLLTAATIEEKDVTVMFPTGHAIKIDKNTAVTVSNQSGTANIKIFCEIFYYVDETTNA